MPLKNFENIGTLQQYEYLKGVITSTPDSATDTCTVRVRVAGNNTDGSNTFQDVEFPDTPIFYHCNPESVERSNGAIEGSAAGFAIDDEVIVLKQRIYPEPSIFVIGHIDGIRSCTKAAIVFYYQESGIKSYYVFKKLSLNGTVSTFDVKHPDTEATITQPILFNSNLLYDGSGVTIAELLTYNGLTLAFASTSEANATLSQDFVAEQYVGYDHFQQLRGVIYTPIGTTYFDPIVIEPDLYKNFNYVIYTIPCDSPIVPPCGRVDRTEELTITQSPTAKFATLLPPSTQCPTPRTGLPFGYYVKSHLRYDYAQYYNTLMDSEEYVEAIAYFLNGSKISIECPGIGPSSTASYRDGGFYYANGIGIGWEQIYVVFTGISTHYYINIYFESEMSVKSTDPPITYNYDVESLSIILDTDDLVGFFSGVANAKPKIYNVYSQN